MTKKKCTLAVSMMVILLLLCSCKKNNENTKESFSRKDWAIMLSEAYDVDFYFKDEPYYEDVTEDDEIFEIIQAMYEAGILSQGTSKFKPKDKATLGFVISSAVLASGIDYTSYDVNPKKALIKCAKSYKIYEGDASSEELTKPVSKEKANDILQKILKINDL